MMELLIKPELEVQCLILPSAGRAGSGTSGLLQSQSPARSASSSTFTFPTFLATWPGSGLPGLRSE